MIKMTAVMTIAMFLGASIAPICTAEELDGEIKATVELYVGVVYPELCIDNSNVKFKVNITGDKNYTVEDVLTIPLNITDNSDRDVFVFPRTIFYSVIIQRPVLDAKLLPLMGFFKRMFPVLKLLKSVNVIGGMLGETQKSLNITLDYSLTNNTYLEGENLTMHLLVMGFLPGEVNGISKGLPIIEHKTINLKVTYEELIE